MSDVTLILKAIERGDPLATDKLLPLVYEELKRIASARLNNERVDHFWQPTVLVHEAYVRLVDREEPQDWDGRGHFFAAAAEAMRRILVENARQRATQKYGGGMRRVELLDVPGEEVADPIDLVALDEALSEFESEWPEKANLVKLRFFAGMTIPESASALGISRATAERYWTFARTWLFARLKK
ncbi:MAG: ECF-type sigma factor [Planctomycetota bacterium]